MRIGKYSDSATGGGAGRGTRPGSVVVQSGDSVSIIAARYGLDTREIIVANNLSPPYTIYPGQRLHLPQPKLYVVEGGDTLSGIAAGLGVEMAALAARNGLRAPYRIYPGQALEVPDGRAIRTVAAAPARAAADASLPSARRAASPAPRAAGNPAPAAKPAPAPAPRKAVAAPPPRSGKPFGWPLTGQILSRFGPKEGGLQNDGINIAARSGDPVRAADNGVVVYSGNELAGFGNLLLLRHGDGWVTAYAHNERLLVKRGDTVNRGQIIARAGRTGSVSSPQLHFEIRQGRQAVDPLDHLPRMTAMQTAAN
ncbi:peptidoglycan DD-metalloendopeptidase family protein [Marinibaculum pumilum]|uniref:Peptidoglycan DD-metalloendopeptidase family protein n=1 Tax=Marinibaculum pumilum TaxID=1766165 RepID=A0ABV7KWE8_9PROT